MSRPDPIAEDAALVAQAQAGDQAAFAELACRYRPALVALGFDRTHNFDDAEDLAQEALVRALEHLRELKEPAAFPAWLRSIAANLCASWTRRPAAFPLDERAAGDDPDVVAAVIARHEQRELARALQHLPTANRLALLMHTRDGMSYERIAAFLGVPVSTIEGRIFRARERLRRSLLDKAASSRHRNKENRND